MDCPSKRFSTLSSAMSRYCLYFLRIHQIKSLPVSIQSTSFPRCQGRIVLRRTVWSIQQRIRRLHRRVVDSVHISWNQGENKVWCKIFSSFAPCNEQWKGEFTRIPILRSISSVFFGKQLLVYVLLIGGHTTISAVIISLAVRGDFECFLLPLRILFFQRFIRR
jgi:hypothetical protein